VSWVLELLIGVFVLTGLVVLLGPGLWSSRLAIHKSDDPKDPPKPKPRA
jgi:hypothetical protein